MLTGGREADAIRFFNFSEDIEQVLTVAHNLSVDQWNLTPQCLVAYSTAVYNTMLRIKGVRLYQDSEHWQPARLLNVASHGNCLFDSIATHVKGIGLDLNDKWRRCHEVRTEIMEFIEKAYNTIRSEHEAGQRLDPISRRPVCESNPRVRLFSTLFFTNTCMKTPAEM